MYIYYENKNNTVYTKRISLIIYKSGQFGGS